MFTYGWELLTIIQPLCAGKVNMPTTTGGFYLIADWKVITQSNLLKIIKVQPSIKGAKIKIRQFNFQLTFNGYICKGKDLY